MILKRRYSYFMYALLMALQVSNQAWAQKSVKPESIKQGIRVISRAYKDSVKLRWAPTDPILWQQSRKYGYRVEKFLVYKAGKILDKPQKLPLPKSTFRPWPLARWQPWLEKDPQVTIAYQAIFGEKMPITTSNPMIKIAQQEQEQKLRFAFALMAADYSALVAKASGLSLTDRAVKKGEKYLYRVMLNIPPQVAKADTGLVYTGVDDYQPLPSPLELEGKFGDKNVLLVWNQLYYQQIYSAYFVERSEDGKNYQFTSKLPIAPVERDTLGGVPTRLMSRIDSLPQNNKTYYFRVRGITPFAEIGPPSDSVVVGQGKPQKNWQIALQKPTINGQKVQLQWQFRGNPGIKVKGFKVEKAPKAQGKYEAIHPGLLPKNQQSYVDAVAEGVQYYRVKVLDEQGEETLSFPHLVQLPDSIPPDEPILLKGEIDTLGKVTIRWSPPRQAKDVKGYHIFRSEGINDEYSRLNVTLAKDTVFEDRITLRTLNPHIHYRIQAIDHYFNPSPQSKILRLKRPDKVPPLTPVLVKATATDSAVLVTWVPSVSRDVAHHLIYRTEQGKDAWQLQAHFTRLDTSALSKQQDTLLNQIQYLYADATAQPGRRYQYTLIAVDSSRLESPPARPMSGQRLTKVLLPTVQNLKIEKNTRPKQITLTWEYDQSQATRFRVYRATGDERLRMYKTIQAKKGSQTIQFNDGEISKGKWYQYRVKPIPGKDKQAKFSKTVSIKF